MIPIIKIDGRELPILIHGTSPFIGAAQFGSRAEEYHRRFYQNPILMSQFFVYFSSKCYPCVHITTHPPIIEATEIASEIRSINVIATVEDETDLELIAKFDPLIVFLHASVTDRSNAREIEEFAEACNDLGYIPGVATHNPGESIPMTDKIKAIKAYMVPINPLGFLMSPSFDSTLIAIENARKNNKYIFGMKTLAGGRINPYKGFPFALNYAHAIIVGFTELKQIDEACSLVKKIVEEDIY
ncbi:MAG: hypothetical protein H0Z28_09845 [Archaeoglobus sp.]|nr:hypothetical protein [Archaeoglobus sp.]